MLDEKYVDSYCRIHADRLYNLLVAEAEWLALKDKNVENWALYNEALNDYVKDGVENLKESGSIFAIGSIPEEKTKSFKEFVDWESTEIIKAYIEE